MASATVYLTALCSPWLLSSFLALVFFLSLLGYLPFKYVYNAVSLSLFTALCVMSAAYAGTGTSLRRSAAKAGRQSARSAANRRKQVKFTKLTLIVTLTFLVSWCPFQILNIVFYVCTIRGMFCTPVISASAVQSVKLLQYASSMANPAIYSFKIPEFRGVIKEKTSLLRARGSTRALKMNQRRDGLELTVES
ncbi:predicted protein [Nematostella vectensis]|uniref:G-protein coupled receptors family 1 profile domain-containing protein n=1 Tax=Nematostella vectensis TaxID=45351 RepID=A7RRT1_NEMVE|nr:predicted protein [Nematostella vectensis]|eukprot:XP_001637880.1 predicted protein [Nematostella vectensis]